MTKILNIIWPLLTSMSLSPSTLPWFHFLKYVNLFYAVPHDRISLSTFSAQLAFSHHLHLSQKGPIIHLGPHIILSQSGLHFFFIAFIHILNYKRFLQCHSPLPDCRLQEERPLPSHFCLQLCIQNLAQCLMQNAQSLFLLKGTQNNFQTHA